MELTVARLNRATLARQLLLDRKDLDLPAAVRTVLALQAQEPASPYLALWNRVAGFDPADLDLHFRQSRIVKATLMRATLHAVAAEDHPVFRAAVLPALRAVAVNDRRFSGPGMDDDLVAAVLEFGSDARSNTEFEAMVRARSDESSAAGLWRAIRLTAPLVHAPTGGAWTFGARPALRAAPGTSDELEPAEGLRALAARYLAAFGPASLLDFAQFAKVARAPARVALAAVPGAVEHRAPDGTVLHDLADAPLPPARIPAPPRLLGMWDSVLLAHFDRGRLMDPETRRLVIRANGDTLPALLVDGRVAGVWRPVPEPQGIQIEVTAFAPLAARAWRALEPEAAALAALLAERDPTTYRRYRRWWEQLPAGEVRTLGG